MLGFLSCIFCMVGSSFVQSLSLKVLICESCVVVIVLKILVGVSALKVRGQLISAALNFVSQVFVRLCVLHLLAHFVLLIFLIVVLIEVSICVSFHFSVIFCECISFSLMVMMSGGGSPGLIDAK